jgi:hypothetical protein
MDSRDIARMVAHERATDERVAMVAKVSRKRSEKARTVARRTARQAKWNMLGKGA